jgi:hypothetical protein
MFLPSGSFANRYVVALWELESNVAYRHFVTWLFFLQEASLLNITNHACQLFSEAEVGFCQISEFLKQFHHYNSRSIKSMPCLHSVKRHTSYYSFCRRSVYRLIQGHGSLLDFIIIISLVTVIS